MAKPSNRELLSIRAYARHRGVAHTSVLEAIQKGRISTSSRGQIDPVVADREWEKNTDQSKPRNSVIGDPKHRRDHKKPPQPMDLDGSRRRTTGGEMGYATARAAREVYDAQLAKLKLDREMGTVVSAEEVRAAASAASRHTRDQLMAIPERVAANIAATDDPEEVRRILDEEIERVCQELSSADAERA